MRLISTTSARRATTGALLLLVACTSGSNDPTTSDFMITAGPTTGSSTAAPETTTPETAATTTGEVLPEIIDLYIYENPANVLSFFVEWETSAPGTGELTVECGDEYSQTFVADAEDTLKALDPTLGLPAEERVWVSTIHKAKGREWRCVLLPGLTEGRCPAQERGDVLPGSEAEPDGIEQSPWIEQERRIFYVGLTRASERVYLQASPSAPSRFLEEMRGVWSGERGRQAASSPSPRASGAAWTEAADQALIDAWATDEGLEAIAERCGRSVTAIVRRVVRLGLARSAGEARMRPRV